MWVFMNDAFVSIVEDRNKPRNLLVRARRAGDLERLLGNGVQVTELEDADYRYRVSVSRGKLARAVVRRLMKISYDNFKNSVKDQKLHAAYMSVWFEMLRVQRAEHPVATAERGGFWEHESAGYPPVCRNPRCILPIRHWGECELPADE